MAETSPEKKSNRLRSPEEILMQSKYEANRLMTPIEASDEIVSIFCALHGGMEAAMPMIVHQFKKAKVDFANPTKEGLRRVAAGLVKVTEFLKGRVIAEKEEKRFKYILRMIAS